MNQENEEQGGQPAFQIGRVAKISSFAPAETTLHELTKSTDHHHEDSPKNKDDAGEYILLQT